MTERKTEFLSMPEGVNELKSDLADKLPKSPSNWESWTAEEQATAREKMGIHKVTQAEYDALTDTSGIYIIVEE